MPAAQQQGVTPVANREEAERRKNELVYVGADPYFCIDKNMTHSIPYLVPRAHDLLSDIGRNFLDSLYVKGSPLHRIIVSSILRTEDDVQRLRRGATATPASDAATATAPPSTSPTTGTLRFRIQTAPSAVQSGTTRRTGCSARC